MSARVSGSDSFLFSCAISNLVSVGVRVRVRAGVRARARVTVRVCLLTHLREVDRLDALL